MNVVKDGSELETETDMLSPGYASCHYEVDEFLTNYVGGK